MIKKKRYNVMLNPRSMEILEAQSLKLDVSRSSLIDRIINDYIFDEGLFLAVPDSDIIDGQEVFIL